MTYFTVGELKVGLYAVLVAVLILLFIVISISYACWLAKHGRKRAEAREKAAQANTHSWGNDVYLDPDDYGKEDSTVVGNIERGSRASVSSDSDGELPSDTRWREGDEYKGKLTRGKSGLRDHSTKAKVSLRRNLGPLNESQEAAEDTDDVDAAAMLGEEKLERWSETPREVGGDDTARGLDSGAGSPEPAEGSQLDPYATRERALKAIQAERANKPAIAVAAADKSNYLAVQPAESRAQQAESTAPSEAIKATLGRREVTKAELEELYRTAFDQGVFAAGGAKGPGVVRRVTPAQLDRLWETAFEDGARAAGATEPEITNARQAYAAERARQGVFKATVDLTQLQIEQMWTEAFDEGGRAGARLLAGRGLDSQHRSPDVQPVPLHDPTAYYPAAVRMSSPTQEYVLPTALRDAPRRKGKHRSMPQAPREPVPIQQQAQWGAVAGPGASGIDPYISGQYPSYAGHLPPQPWDARLVPPPAALPVQAYPSAWGAGDPYAYNAANPYTAEAAQALPAVVVSPPTRKLGRKSMSGSSRRAMEKKAAKEERRRRAQNASAGFAPYGDAPYQPIGVATANPELKRELVASFASGYIRPTYPEPMPPPSPGYTAQSAPLW